MKNFVLFSIFIVILMATSAVRGFAQVAINTDGSAPNTNAILDVKSTAKGFLPPRMTNAEINAIVLPAAGLLIYCTDCNDGVGCLITYQNTKWECTGGSGALLPAPVAAAPTSASCGGFTANWEVVTDATRYYLDVSTSSGFGSYVPGYANLNVGNVLS